jgi:hypothetical protein
LKRVEAVAVTRARGTENIIVRGGGGPRIQGPTAIRGRRAIRWSFYHVTFYSDDCVKETMELETRDGRPCMWEPGLIVVESVTMSNMQSAVDCLEGESLFKQPVPIKDPGEWGRAVLAPFEKGAGPMSQ